MNYLLTLIIGIVFGIIDILPMIRMKLDKFAISSAFMFYCIAPFIVYNTNLFGMPWWLKGGVITLLIAVPTIILIAKDGIKTIIPVIVMSVVLGTLIGVVGHLAFDCKKNEETTPKVSSVSSATGVSQNINLADGTYNWFINADEVGSSVANFENAENSLKFSLTRETEIPEEEKWTWSEIMVDSTNADWTGFSGMEITYKADRNLRVILMDGELEESDAAAGFWVVLPITGNDTTITFNPEDFRQHDWVFEQFPDIRKTIDNTKLYGIKIGTQAQNETTDAVISKFVLNGVTAEG